MLTTGEELFEGLKNRDVGNNTHLDLEGLGLWPMFISSPNLTW